MARLEIQEIGGEDRSGVTVPGTVSRESALENCRKAAEARRGMRNSDSRYRALLDGEEIGVV